MNTTPATTQKSLAPFAAVLHFKPDQLYQKKHASWTFRSDHVSPHQTPIHKQFAFLENLVLKELKGTYITASVFNNCGLLHVPYGEEAPRNNLVLYVDHDNITIDRRSYIDISFLEPTFDRNFLEWLADDFYNQKFLLDLQAGHLREYASLYRQNVLGTK